MKEIDTDFTEGAFFVVYASLISKCWYENKIRNIKIWNTCSVLNYLFIRTLNKLAITHLCHSQSHRLQGVANYCVEYAQDKSVEARFCMVWDGSIWFYNFR